MSRASDDLAAPRIFARNFPGPDFHQLVTAKAAAPVRLRYTNPVADQGLRDFLLCRESGRTRSGVIGGSLLPMGLVLIGE